MRWDYVDAGQPTQTFVFNGTTYVSLDQAKHEATVGRTDDQTLPAAIGFMLEPAIFERFWINFDSTQAQNVPSGHRVLRLTPKQSMTNIADWWLVVDPNHSYVVESVSVSPAQQFAGSGDNSV